MIVSTPNPFRVGTKLHKIFEVMKDGKPRTLDQITGAVAGYRLPTPHSCGCVLCVRDQRRVASALRTIRAKPRLDVFWSTSGKTYRMVGYNSP